MKTEIVTSVIGIIGAALGAAISLIGLYLNNRIQLKRDRIKNLHDRDIIELKMKSEEESKYKSLILQNIERVNSALGKVEHDLSLTASVIDSMHKLNHLDFDKKCLIERNELTSLESIAVVYFPGIIASIRRLINLHNNYWGHQKLLLMCDVDSEPQRYQMLQRKIIEISDNAYAEIGEVRHEIIKIAENINHRVVEVNA